MKGHNSFMVRRTRISHITVDHGEPTSAKIAQKSFLGGTVLKTIMGNVEFVWSLFGASRI